MQNFYSPYPAESISLKVEWSPVWEVALGIAGYTYAQLRHTFDLDEKWDADQSNMSPTLLKHLEVMEETNFWHGLLMLQNHFSASSIQDFSNRLSNVPSDLLYEILLPYKDRGTEKLRQETAVGHHERRAFERYAAYFKDHDYLAGYIRALGQYSAQDVRDLFNDTLNEWYNYVSQQEEWDKWTEALAFEQKQHPSIDSSNPIKEIERITGGIQYIPEPSVWTVKLIPHVSYRPWTLEKRSPDTKLFFYPLKEEYLMEPGIPSRELVRGHKALGDELRLKLLYQLLKGPLSLQEMSIQFHVSKTTLHHHLSLLKAAKFIRVEKGIYEANPTQIRTFSERLPQYLGDYL